MVKGGRNMKLIDILNLIAKGELEEGTKIIYDDYSYKYQGGDFIRFDVLNHMVSLFENIWPTNLNDKVEIIGHDTNVATKIEEIDTEFLRYTFECEGTFRPVKAITSLGDKLNEVIRELNGRSK